MKKVLIVLGVICGLMLTGSISAYFLYVVPKHQDEQLQFEQMKYSQERQDKTDAAAKTIQDEKDKQERISEVLNDLNNNNNFKVPPPIPINFINPPVAQPAKFSWDSGILKDRTNFPIDKECKTNGQKYMNKIYKQEDNEQFIGEVHYKIFYSKKLNGCFYVSYAFGNGDLLPGQQSPTAYLNIIDISSDKTAWKEELENSSITQVEEKLNQQIKSMQ